MAVNKHPTIQRNFDECLRKRNFKVNGILVATPIPELLRGINSHYHTDPTTHYTRVKRDFEGFEIKVTAGAPILDWGCSVGATTVAIANMYPRNPVYGIDISEVRIKIAAEKTIKEAQDGYVSVYMKNLGCMVHEYISEPKPLRLPKFFVADGFMPPFADNSFAMVYCMHNIYYSFERVNNDQMRKMLAPIASIISPGGYLMISGGRANLSLESMALRKGDGFSVAFTNFSPDKDGAGERIGRILDMLRP
jgi:hypothetical protein